MSVELEFVESISKCNFSRSGELTVAPGSPDHGCHVSLHECCASLGDKELQSSFPLSGTDFRLPLPFPRPHADSPIESAEIQVSILARTPGDNPQSRAR